MKALVLIEQKEGNVKKSSLEVIHAFKEKGFEVSAICLGEGLNAQNIAAQTGDQGATQVYIVNDGGLKFYQPDTYKETLAKVFADGGFTTLAGSATALVKD